jgi:hypothetical protein
MFVGKSRMFEVKFRVGYIRITCFESVSNFGGCYHWVALLSSFGSARESVKASGFAGFLHFVNFDEAAAVAVEMWEAAFSAAFQARRAGIRMWFQVPPPRPPSAISIANCRISGIFRDSGLLRVVGNQNVGI